MTICVRVDVVVCPAISSVCESRPGVIMMGREVRDAGGQDVVAPSLFDVFSFFFCLFVRCEKTTAQEVCTRVFSCAYARVRSCVGVCTHVQLF